MRLPHRPLSTAFACAALALAAIPATAGADALDNRVDRDFVYLHSAVGEPWESQGGGDANRAAMDKAFGGGNWDREVFETVDTGSLFAAPIRFIFLDGSDNGADELEAFLGAHESELKLFVQEGGALIVNSAPNEGDGMTYDGRTIDDANSSDAVRAADSHHPVFNGPHTPVGTDFTGSSYAHATVLGNGTPVILGTVGDVPGGPTDPNKVVLLEYETGTGITLIGGMTTTNFHDPDPNALNLRANIFAYAASKADVEAPAGQTTPGTTSQPQPSAPLAAAPPGLSRIAATAFGSRTIGRDGLLSLPWSETCVAGPCNAYERLFTAKAGARGSSHGPRHGLLARDRDTIGSGQTHQVRVRLSRAARRVLRRKRRMRVEVIVTVTDALRRPVTARRTFTLRAR